MRTLLALLFLSFATTSAANNTNVWFDPEQDGHGVTLFEWDENRVFYWYAHHPAFGQLWFLSSVESGDDFVLFRPTAPAFPTSDQISLGLPVGTATLVETEEGLSFSWNLFVEEVTCGSLYGPVPPGPLDPRCQDESLRFVPTRVLQPGIDEIGAASFIRLVP